MVGAGYWGKNHIHTLHALGLLGGIVESDREVLSYFAKKYSGVHTYENINDALKNEEFHGFTIATPAETHYDISKQIIQSKKHVLVEKPLTLNIEHALELVDLAGKYGVNLIVGHVG